MGLVSTTRMLKDAKEKKYAVPAFNIENMEMAMAVIKAASLLNSPVIIQTTPGTIAYGDLDIFYANVASLANKTTIPIAIHLDHGNSFELAVKAIRAGYTSVMIDGSKLSFEDNIELTSRVVAVADPSGVSVEAELGTVGGKEDGMDGGSGSYTDPVKAIEFVQRTGISSLAIAIGTAHGIYSGEPILDKARLEEINSLVAAPLVLHGASGISEKDIKDCIAKGISKVNIATELRIAYSKGVKRIIAEQPNVIDPKVYGKEGRKEVEELVKVYIEMCGSTNKG